MTNDICELKYLAGLFEQGGGFGITNQRHKYTYATVYLEGPNEVVDRVRELIHHVGSYTQRNPETARLVLTGTRAEEFMRAIQHLLVGPRKNRIQEILGEIKTPRE